MSSSSSNCNNCFSASVKCNKTKDELKCSKNEVKKMEKKMKETEKELIASRTLIEDLKAQRQTRLSIKDQLAEMQKEMEKLMAENEKEQRLNEELEAEHVKIQATLPMCKEERLDVIFELQVEISRLNATRVYQQAMLRTLQLGQVDDWKVKKLAALEKLYFQEKYEAYEKALKANLVKVQANPNISRSEIPMLPDQPKFSEKFEEEFKRMEDAKREAKNRELEEECIICKEVMDTRKLAELFICPVCRNMIHTDCVEEWFQRNKSCPCCRTACH